MTEERTERHFERESCFELTYGIRLWKTLDTVTPLFGVKFPFIDFRIVDEITIISTLKPEPDGTR